MTRKAGTKPITVPLSEDEHAFLVRLSERYRPMSVGAIAHILVAYAIPKADEAMGLPAKIMLQEEPPRTIIR